VNLKDYIIPVFFSVIMTALIQRYFFNKQLEQSKMEAQALIKTERPLEFDLNFEEYNPAIVEQRSLVETVWSDIQFSTHGGSICHIQTKPGKGLSVNVTTSDSLNTASRDMSNILVFSDQETAMPYQFSLLQSENIKDKYLLVYKGQNKNVVIYKQFEISIDRPLIRFTLTIEPLKNTPLITRIRMYGPPYDQLTSHIVFVDRNNSFNKIGSASFDNDHYPVSNPQLAGVDNRYFIHAMTHGQGVNRVYYNIHDKQPGMTIEMNPIQEKTIFNYDFYMGPKDLEMLRSVDSRLEQSLDYHGWFAYLSKLLLRILKFLYEYSGNYGFAIILLTILMKILLLPFTFNSEKNMQKQKELQKKIAYLRVKYKNSPEEFQREQALLMRKYGIPSLISLLPMLLQIPFFFALSRLLSYSIELYKAPFFWISDLSAPDNFYILPLLVFFSMLVTAMQADEKQQITLIALALVFGAATASLASGLALYLITSAFVNFLQGYLIQLWNRNRNNVVV